MTGHSGFQSGSRGPTGHYEHEVSRWRSLVCFFVFFCFFVSFFPLFCRVNVSGVKFGWDAKGKCLVKRLSYRRASCVLRNTEILYGRGLVRKGYRRVPNTLSTSSSHPTYMRKSVKWYTGIPNIHFLQIQVIQHKTNKKAGWFKISFRF